MARTTKQLSGGGKDKFLRALIAEEPLIEPEGARRLGDALCGSIADIRVRRDKWHGGREGARNAVAVEALATSSPAEEAVVDPRPAAQAFDPFAFSALAVLARQGKASLDARLQSIADAADLHALARAQHLAVDPALDDVGPLRAAILAATEARLAERRAAAS